MSRHHWQRRVIGAAALSSLLLATSCSSCSTGPEPSPTDSGPNCPGAAPLCGALCCTVDQECFEGSCLPRCATGVRCGAANDLCCAADEECTGGACEKRCAPNCQKPGGTGVKECGDDGCGHPCPPGCQLGETCTPDFHCVPDVVTGNDSCGSASALIFISGSAVVHGDTTLARRDIYASCTQSQYGSDVVFSMSLASRKKVNASVTADAGSWLWPVVVLRTGPCSSTMNGSDLACAMAATQADRASVELANLNPGQFFLWVSSSVPAANGAGRFTLTVTLSEPDQPAPTNDTCANATALDLTTGSATATGDLLWAANDAMAFMCSPGTDTSGADVVYTFTVPSGGLDFAARLSFDDANTQNQAALYLRSGCDATANELVCSSNYRNASVYVPALDAGTYYLFVDSSLPMGEAFHVSAQVGTAPANDSCTSGAQPLTLDAATGQATATGDTTFANANAQGASTCGQTTRDVVYKLHTDAVKTLTMTVTPAEGSGFQPIIYIRSQCENPSGATPASIACGYGYPAGTPATARVTRLAAGDWYLWVGGMGPNASGPFTLEVTAADVVLPPNDTCSTPTVLQLDPSTKKVSVTGNTDFALPDYDPTTCPYVPTSSNDLVYKVTLSEAGSLTAKVTPAGTATGFYPVVYIRTVCASALPADEKACATGTSGGAGNAATALIPSAEATDYYIIVDGYNTGSGGFALDVAEGPLVANDACTHPEEILIDTATGIGTATGDTSYGKADDFGSCQGGSYRSSNDLTYTFTLAQERSVIIDVTPASGSTLIPAIYLRTVCETAASEVIGGCIAATTASTTQLALNVLSAGAYYLWVDGATGTSGPFTVTVMTSTPPAAPASDSCATAQTLTLTASASDPATSTASLTGLALANARNDAVGSALCSNSMAGDLVFKFTLGSAQKVTATVTPGPSTPTYQPVVYIRQTCGGSTDADQLACGAAQRAGQSATATANSLAAGDYFIWVDGVTSGQLSLDVTATTPVAGPSNDNCSAPTALSFTGTTAMTASAAGTTVNAQNDIAGQYGTGNPGGDVVYSLAFTANYPRRIIAVAAAATGAPSGFRPYVSIHATCGTTAELAQGSTSQPSTASVPSANAGTYFVWVDTNGTSPVPGPFNLTVTLELPNDQCTAATALTAGTVVSGDTSLAVDQYGTNGGFSAVCTAALGTNTATTGPDLVYLYRPTVPGNFTITVTPSATFDPIIWVNFNTSSACGNPAACLNLADAAGAGGAETLTIGGTVNAPYYIIVDSASAAMAGSFTIEVQ